MGRCVGCESCKYEALTLNAIPCRQCRAIYIYSEWEPKEAVELEPSCANCKNVVECSSCEWSNETGVVPSNYAPLQTECVFCATHCAGETLHGGVGNGNNGFAYAIDAQYCPLCGRKLRLERKEEKS